MAKKKISRKELLKGQDEFLTFSERSVIFIREHLKQFKALGIAVLAVILIYLGINGYLRYVNKKGQESYNMAYSALLQNMHEEADPEALKESQTILRQVMDEYGLAKVSRLAAPELAYLKFRDKAYDEAVSLYASFLKDVPKKSPYSSMTRLALAACYEEKGDLPKAAESLEEILASREDFFKEQAMLNLARVYTLQNDEGKSKAILGEFIEKFKDSSFLPLAKALLAK